MRVTIPRWAQFVLVPVAVILVLYFGRAASHAVFVFLMSSIVALLLNPVVLVLHHRAKCPRWLAVPLVYLVFVAAVVLLFVYLGPPLIRQFQRLIEAIPSWLEALNGAFADLESWLASHNINVSLQFNTADIVDWLQSRGAESIGALLSVGWSVVGAVVNLFLTVVISFYMLIDGHRVFRFLCRLAPGEQQVKEGYVRGLQKAFSRYVRSQALLGLTIAVLCGFAIWVLSWERVGIWPEGGQWALLFGLWAGVTEVIPYVGPFLGAVPPVVAAFFHSPWAALVVAIVYFVIQQLEGHILAPNIVGSSVGVHPLLVIFALLAGAQVGGILGMVAALPILAMLRHTFTFYDFKLSRSSWAGSDGAVLVTASSTGPPGGPPTAEVPPAEPVNAEAAKSKRAAGRRPRRRRAQAAGGPGDKPGDE